MNNALQILRYKFLISVFLIQFVIGCINCNSVSPILDNYYLDQSYLVTKDSLSTTNNSYYPFFTAISSSAFLNDTSYIFKTSTSNKVEVFSTHGEKIDYIELSNCHLPSIHSGPVKVHKDSIYVWCENRSSIQVYDNNLSLAYEIYCPKTKSLRDFIVNDSLIVFYNNSKSHYLISIYERSTGNYLFETGKSTIEHYVLQQGINSGGVILIGNSIFYCRADCLNIYVINLDSFYEGVIEINSPEFIVNRFPDQRFDAQLDLNQTYRYIATNSYVAGLFHINNEFIIISEVGTYSHKFPSGRIDYDNRYFLFLSYNSEKGTKKSLTRINDPMQSSEFVSFLTNGIDLFSISPTFSKQNEWIFLISKHALIPTVKSSQL